MFDCSSLVIVYNLPDVANLNLSLSVLADIYKGKIQYWNDSRIQSNNVGVKLPLVQIELVARKDMAFETYIFTSALSTYDPDWPVKPFSSPNFTDDQISRNWPAKIHHYAKGETGMAGVVLSVPYAIGYISHVAANSYNIDHVALINRAGVATQANVVSVQSAVRYFYQLQGIRLRSPLINAEQADSYPIVWLSQLSINYQPNDCCVVRETIGFALSVLNNTENMKTYIAPILPEMTKAIIEGILSNITCQGRNIYKDFLQSQLINENEFIQDGIQIWQIIVIFVAGFILISLVSALILMIQRKKVERQEDGKWLVPFNRLQIWETEKENMGSATLLAEAKLKIQQKFQYLHIVREFEDNKVCLEELVIDDPHKWTRETKALMAQFRRNFRHLNVAGFFGFTNEGSKVFCVSEFCAKGSVHYVLTTTRHSLDNSIKYNMACDVAEGLMFLHHKGVHVGMLNSLSCCVDSHWTVKIKQWQHSTLFKNENLMNMLVFTPYKENLQNDITLINLLYVEPMTYNTKIFTAQSDIYSMGMLLFQIFARCLPYSYEVENGSYSYAEVFNIWFPLALVATSIIKYFKNIYFISTYQPRSLTGQPHNSTFLSNYNTRNYLIVYCLFYGSKFMNDLRKQH